MQTALPLVPVNFSGSKLHAEIGRHLSSWLVLNPGEPACSLTVPVSALCLVHIVFIEAGGSSGGRLRGELSGLVQLPRKKNSLIVKLCQAHIH